MIKPTKGGDLMVNNENIKDFQGRIDNAITELSEWTNENKEELIKYYELEDVNIEEMSDFAQDSIDSLENLFYSLRDIRTDIIK